MFVDGMSASSLNCLSHASAPWAGKGGARVRRDVRALVSTDPLGFGRKRSVDQIEEGIHPRFSRSFVACPPHSRSGGTATRFLHLMPASGPCGGPRRSSELLLAALRPFGA